MAGRPRGVLEARPAGPGRASASAGWTGCRASRTSSRSRSRRSTSRRRGTGTGSYSMPTTRSTARERSSSSAGRGLALDDLDLQVGRGRGESARTRLAAARARASARTSSAAARAARRPSAASSARTASSAASASPACAASRRPAAVSSTLRPGAAQQLGARLALELGELDRHRRRAVGERLGDRRDRPEPGQLVEQPKTAQFHRSDYRTFSRRKSALVSNDVVHRAWRHDPRPAAPRPARRRRPPPRSSADSARPPPAGSPRCRSPSASPSSPSRSTPAPGAGAMALSAASQVPAQVAFGVVFAAVLLRRGLRSGARRRERWPTSPARSRSSHVPAAIVIAAALPMLALAPRLMDGRSPAARRRPARWTTTAIACAGGVGDRRPRRC